MGVNDLRVGSVILHAYRIQQLILTDSLPNAFTRFTRRQGVHVPKGRISENGTNFVGTVNEVKKLVGQLDKDEIQETTAQKGVKRTCNPPGAPRAK